MGVSESDLLHVIIFSVLLSLPISLAEDDPNYTLCSRNFACGLLQNLSYPFWGGPNRTDVCGRNISELECEANQYPVVHHYDQKFRMLHVNESLKQMAIVLQELWDDILCPDSLFNQTLRRFPSINPERRRKSLTFYWNCGSRFREPSIDRFPCRYNREHVDEGYGFYSSEEISDEECRFKARVWVPQEFVVNALKYEEDSVCFACEHSGGVCGTNNTDSGKFACFCKDGDHDLYCEEHGNRLNMPRKVFIGLGTAGFTVTVMIAIYFFFKRRKDRTKYMPSSFVSRSIDQSLKGDMEKGSKYYGLHIFSYAELEEATNNFEADRELGDGGFGTVYYGKLRDGRSVAVKRLYETNCRRFEQFMNEIDILTRLRHTHLVSLYGCTSRHSRELLLVYEYIPNGTVADNLHGEKAKPSGLPWTIRMNIAVETASALRYLHASDIIHRDVKTNNILLDDNFCVKVADFGLSRLFPTDVTHVSTAPQGTPGYVDPDYHQCYQLTDKSDVFSFGVVLIELISSLPAVDITRHRHEINLSNLAINKIQNDALHELVDSNLGYDSNYIVRKMINAVAELAFQCLQSDKDLRPSMDEVLERLQSIQSKDYFSNKQEEIGVASSDATPLTNKALMLSPNSVMFQWQSSNSTTPNSSGKV